MFFSFFAGKRAWEDCLIDILWMEILKPKHSDTEPCLFAFGCIISLQVALSRYQVYGLDTKPWFNFAVACPIQLGFQISRIWRRNVETFFPCSIIFDIQALYEYKSMCTDTLRRMLVCCLSAISLNVYICMKISRYISGG